VTVNSDGALQILEAHSDVQLIFTDVKGPPVLPPAPLFGRMGGDRRENRLRDRQREPQISILDIPTERAKRNASSYAGGNICLSRALNFI
jgi:hypothetical protein